MQPPFLVYVGHASVHSVSTSLCHVPLLCSHAGQCQSVVTGVLPVLSAIHVYHLHEEVRKSSLDLGFHFDQDCVAMALDRVDKTFTHFPAGSS